MTKEQFEAIVKFHSVIKYDEFFSANAFLGEAGELANARKKQVYKNDFPHAASLQMTDYHENSIDEYGDTLFYLVQWMSKAGITIEEAMEHQADKLVRQSKEVQGIYRK